MVVCVYKYGGFPSPWGYPKMVGFWWKIPLKWMIWGYPYFRKPSYFYRPTNRTWGPKKLISCDPGGAKLRPGLSSEDAARARMELLMGNASWPCWT